MRRALIAVGLGAVVGGCGSKPNDKPIDPTPKRDGGGATGSDVAELPAPPTLPSVPAGLPTPPDHPGVTAAAVALGELLFHDPRLSSTGKLSCATCHDPTTGFAGNGRQTTALGKPNLRRAPALVNLAWTTRLGWEGRYGAMQDLLPLHVRGQLGEDLATSVARLGALPVYQAHFTRTGGPTADIAATALGAYVLTRYVGDAPWDRVERSPDAPADLKAGYTLFTTKAQCAVCHTPPLYTDLGYHRLGLIAVADEGRGRVDPTPAQKGAFRTPTLRGAAARTTLFHDASAATLDAAIDWHLAGGIGQGADPSIVDLKPVTLTPDERAQLGAFVRSLTTPGPVAKPPTLP